MVFDRELCFVNGATLNDFPGGSLGGAIDLGAAHQLLGRQTYVAVACFQDMTATGNPDIHLGLEFSDDAAFSVPIAVPLSLPGLGKGDFTAGSVIAARSPLYSKRYVRFVLDTDIDVTCAGITAGFVTDANG
jgi:hypothetical protein